MMQPQLILQRVFLAACLLCGATHLPAQTSNLPNHIEIVLQSRDTDPSNARREKQLHSLNLQLSTGKHKIPYRLTSAADEVFATHLMILLPGPVADCARTAAPQGLSSLLAPGWSLALAGEDHRSTDWEAGADAWNSACASASRAHASAEDPISLLQQQTGRRVLVFAEAPPRDELRRAQAALPEIYVVDGGRRTWQATASLTLEPSSFPNNSGSLATPFPTINPGAFTSGLQNGATPAAGRRTEEYFAGGWHTKSLDSAFKHIRHASELYYDLAFTAPAAVAGSGGLQLKFRFIDCFTAKTELYAGSPLSPARRAPVPAALVVIP